MKAKWIGIVLIFIATFSMVNCDDDDDVRPSKTFVLIHGAWQGPYAWSSVKAQLEANGQKVVVVELPAHGADMSALAEQTLNGYVSKVEAAINKESAPVILVGHSLGGIVISQVAEKNAARIEKLIYLAAYLPTDGQSLLDLATTDHEATIAGSFVFSEDMLSIDIKEANRTAIFCQDATTEVKNVVSKNFRAEPSIPLTNKAALGTSFKNVDKYYIHTEKDQVIGMTLQKQMVTSAGIPSGQTFSLATSHCAALTMPKEVTDILMEIVF